MDENLYQKIHLDRMKKLNHSEYQSNRSGIKTKYMHISALSPTTRKTHADRHGELFTADEVREFYSDPSNVEGCKCSFPEVMLDDSGKPLTTIAIDRAKAAKKKMEERGYDWSK